MRRARAWSTSKVKRSRWFTPIRSAPHGEGPVELGLVVDLDQHVEVELAGEVVEVGELLVVERRGDQQYAVGTHDAGIGDIAGVDGEVLAEHGQGHGRPGRRQVGGRPAEPVLVGEHGEARGTAPLVGASELGGVEIDEEVALRR